MIEFTVEDFLERCDRIGDLHVFPRATRELLGDEERLREEILQTASPANNRAVFFRKLFDTENRDDVLQIAVALQRFLHAARDAIVIVADDGGIENARG